MPAPNRCGLNPRPGSVPGGRRVETTPATLRLPATLATGSDAAAVAALTKYYGRPYLGEGAYVGAQFDSWSSTGDRAGEADRFTADDLVAVTFLSVQIPPTAARAIL